MNHTEYNTLYDSTIEGLQSQIVESIEAGWSPLGEITIDFDDDVTYFQQMARTEESFAIP